MQLSTVPRESTADRPPGQSFLPQTGRLAFGLVISLFFLWGMSNNLTDILVQHFRKVFQLSQLEAQLVQTAVFFGYFVMAIPAATAVRRWGYKSGLLIGLGLFATGTLLFVPAAIVSRYAAFLCALFVVGCGSAVLETAANPLVAEFGTADTSERRLNFAQSFNPPGTIVGVVIGTLFIFSGVDMPAKEAARLQAAGTLAAHVHAEIMRVVPTYAGLGIVLFLCALLIARVPFPAVAGRPSEADERVPFRGLLRFPGLWMAVVAQFFYVGAQVTTWSAFIPYVRQYTALSERQAGLLLTCNLLSICVGRFASTSIMRYVRPVILLTVYAVLNTVLMSVAIVRPGTLGVAAVVVSSFFMSMMFPTIFALGLKGLGPYTKIGGSVLVMSVVGGAVLPPVLGWISRATGSLAVGYLVTVVAYAVVAAYGLLCVTRRSAPEAGAAPVNDPA